MKDLTDGLNTRFNIALQSTSEKEFYQSLYHYFDYIHKTPELKSIYAESEDKYRNEHIKIWEKRPMIDEEADEAERQTMKLERFNLFALGCSIDVLIHTPIDDYRNTPESDGKQDPIAVMLMKGLKYTIGLKKWRTENLKVYARWFDGKRNQYEVELRRFHLMFLEELAKPRNTKIEVSFDRENSVLNIGDKKIKLKLKNDKPNAHYVLEYIFDNEEGLGTQSFYTDIIKAKFPNEKMEWRSIYRACKDINTKVGIQANIGDFLIVKSGKTGYTQVNSKYT